MPEHDTTYHTLTPYELWERYIEWKKSQEQ